MSVRIYPFFAAGKNASRNIIVYSGSEDLPCALYNKKARQRFSEIIHYPLSIIH